MLHLRGKIKIRQAFRKWFRKEKDFEYGEFGKSINPAIVNFHWTTMRGDDEMNNI